MEKEKKAINVLIAFFISHKSDIKIFLKNEFLTNAARHSLTLFFTFPFSLVPFVLCNFMKGKYMIVGYTSSIYDCIQVRYWTNQTQSVYL